VNSIDAIWLEVTTAEHENLAATIAVFFYDPIQIYIGWCTTMDLESVPTDTDKWMWTFTRTNVELLVQINGVLVFNYVFAESLNDECVAKWAQDGEIIEFDASLDDASDAFRAKPTSECIFIAIITSPGPFCIIMKFGQFYRYNYYYYTNYNTLRKIQHRQRVDCRRQYRDQGLVWSFLRLVHCMDYKRHRGKPVQSRLPSIPK